jgi:uncharacterized protein
MLAARQYGVLAPLLKARMGKVDIRVLAKERGLPNHARPSMACLASRIPYGSAITVEALTQVEESEAFLKREIGLQQVRVRHHGNVARLEVESSELSRLVQRDIRERVIARLQDLGFTYVALDLAGFRSGSMNAALLQESENGRMQHNIMKDSPDSEINGTSR